MIFPKGEVVHQNLSTEYVNIPDLLTSLKSNGFAGVVEIQTPHNKGAFFLSEGKIASAEMESNSQADKFIGDEAIQKLLALSGNEIGSINVYRLNPSQVAIMISRFSSEIVFKGLSTDFVKLDRFLEKLKTEKHDGFIEVFTKMNQPLGVLFIKGGEPVDLHIADEIGDSALSGVNGLSAFQEKVLSQGALFDVYKSSVPNPRKESEPVFTETQAKGPFKRPPIGTLHVIDNEMADVEEETEEGEEENLLSADSKNTILKTLETDGEYDRNKVIGLLQDIIVKTEKFVDGFSQDGIFLRAFKRALIEKSELYPFLDPFADQFVYHSRKIVLDDQVELDQFVPGIADCYNLTLSHLKKEFPKNMNMPAGAKAEMESSLKHYQEALKRAGIESPSLLSFK